MANGNGDGVGHYVSRGLSITAIIGLVALWQFLIAPNREAIDRVDREVQRLRDDSRSGDEKLWKSLEEIRTEMATLQASATTVSRDLSAERQMREGSAGQIALASEDIARRLKVIEERDEWFMRTRIDMAAETAKLQERADAALRKCEAVEPVRAH